MAAKLALGVQQLKDELVGGLIRIQTDPRGVQMELIALEKLGNRLRVLLTE